MRSALRVPFVVALGVLVASSSAAAQAGVDALPGHEEIFRMEALADGVWAAVVRPAAPAFAFANSLVIVDAAGVLVVDTQQSPHAARALLGWIRGRTDAPVRWVVNTHGHADHVWGNGAYREAFPEVSIVAHEATAAFMAEDGEVTRRDQLAGQREAIALREEWLETGRGPDDAPLTEEDRVSLARSLLVRRAYVDEIATLEFVEADVTFEDRRTIEVGEHIVELIHVGPAHTPGDVVVHLPGHGILALGDLIEQAGPWLEGAWIPGWAAFLEHVGTLEADIVLPAHGEVQRDRRLLDWQTEFFEALIDEASRVVSTGRGVEEALEATALERFRPAFAGVGVEGEAFEHYLRTALTEAVADVRSGSGRRGVR